MLVLSRRETEKIFIPCLGMTIEVARIRGKTVSLGFEAPADVRIIRSEIAGEKPARAVTNSEANGFASNGSPLNGATDNDEIREHLESAKLAIRLAQNQLRQGLSDHSAEALVHAIGSLEKLDMVLSPDASKQPASESVELTVHEPPAGYHVGPPALAPTIDVDDLDFEVHLDDGSPSNSYCVVA